MTTGNVTEWYETEYTHACQKLAQAHTDLAQAHIELRQIRKFWLNPAGAADLRRRLKDAETELDRVRQDAQDQSDEVQELWLSPVEAEGLKRQLAQAEAQVASARLAAEEQVIIIKAAKVLIEATGKVHVGSVLREELVAARGRMNNALEYRSEAATKLLERLATLDAAEAALADCGISGIYDIFDGLPDAIEQMTQYIDELTREDRRRTEQVKTLQSERALRQVAETGEQAARKLLSQAIVAQADAELAAHVRSKACDELTQAMHTERRLRREAECERDDINRNLRRMVELNEWSRNELDRVSQRAERAEALAQLVNKETAGLLERLAEGAQMWSMEEMDNDDIKQGRALAAKIREALDEH